MDDYLNIHKYVGDEKQESSTATNISKEEHEMLKITPQKVQQQPQFNHSSTARSENQVQKEDDLRGRIKCFIVMAVIMLAVTLSISLVAIMLSILSYSASNYRAGSNVKEAKEVNLSELLVQFNTHKMDITFELKQLNDTLMQLYSAQNNTQLSVEQLRSDTNIMIDQLTANISNLAIQLNYTNNDVKSVATTVESDISQLSTQLDATNNNIVSVVSTIKKKISQLSTQLEAANNDIRSVATTVQRTYLSCLLSLKQPTMT